MFYFIFCKDNLLPKSFLLFYIFKQRIDPLLRILHFDTYKVVILFNSRLLKEIYIIIHPSHNDAVVPVIQVDVIWLMNNKIFWKTRIWQLNQIFAKMNDISEMNEKTFVLCSRYIVLYLCEHFRFWLYSKISIWKSGKVN